MKKFKFIDRIYMLVVGKEALHCIRKTESMQSGVPVVFEHPNSWLYVKS